MAKSSKDSTLNKTKSLVGKTKTKTAGTTVDLGDDLLDKTNTSTAAKFRKEKTSTREVSGLSEIKIIPTEDELFSNASILFNEGIFDEAKKIFRKILLKNPTSLKARGFLDKIQKKEIADLLSSEGRVLPKLSENVVDEKIEDIIQLLSKDLRVTMDKEVSKVIPDLFRDEFALNQYTQKVKKIVQQANPRDAMDFGVAHLEMGLYSVAKEIFEGLVGLDQYRFSAIYLLVLVLILNGECVEATIRLEPYVRDMTLDENLKVDFLYLMGLAFEHLNETLKSKEFYRRAFLLNPKYRDIVEKIRS